MALVDVIKCCHDSIKQLSEEIEGAIVYLDAGCTESFQFLGAFPLLLELGVCAICSLEEISAFDVDVDCNLGSDLARKIVVITSRLLSDAHRYVLRCLSTHGSVRCCSVFTSISEIAHSSYPDSPLGPDAFREYESLLIQDYEELVKRSGTGTGPKQSQDSVDDERWPQLTSTEPSTKNSYEDDGTGYVQVGQKLVVCVHHFPLILCPLSPRVFVLPSEGSVAEAYLSVQNECSISAGLPPLSTGSLSDGEDLPPGATLTAQLLYHLATKMDLKLETFSLGVLSNTVGKLLTDMSSLYDVGRRKRSGGLLLIDRTLDLLTPCCHGDSLVDRMFASLPRRQRAPQSSQMKGSRTPLKNGLANVKRPPLDFQIPLHRIIIEQDIKEENFRVLESIEAFLHGWKKSNDSASQTAELITLGAKLNSAKPSLSVDELLGGSFVSTETFKGMPYLEAILGRKTKDGAILIKKWLQQTLRRENIALNLKFRPGLPSNNELLTMIKALSKSQSSLLRNKGIINLAAATIHALEELHSAHWDAFNSLEKMLNVIAEDTSHSLAAQISDLINKSALVGLQGKNGKMKPSQGLLTFEDALLLVVAGYLLASENFPTSGSGGLFSWKEEHFMKEAIVDAVLENPSAAKLKFLQGLTGDLEVNCNKKKSGEIKEETLNQLEIDDFDDDQWGSWGDEDVDKDVNKEQAYDNLQLKLELRDRVDNLFKFLHKLSCSKGNLSLRDTFASENNFDGDPCSSKGLLYKLLTRVLSKNDMPGLEYHSSTVGRLFKTGFGRFGLGQAKPSLADHDVIIIFVIGGINGVEVRETQEALSESSRPEVQLILGGTTFLTPNDMFDLLLGDYSYT